MYLTFHCAVYFLHMFSCHLIVAVVVCCFFESVFFVFCSTVYVTCSSVLVLHCVMLYNNVNNKQFVLKSIIH